MHFIHFEIVSVNSYRLVYSTNPSAIINERGEIPESATSFTDNDILEGSLIPAQPYESQTVTINLNRNGPAPAPFYFTIASTRVASNNAVDYYSNRILILMVPFFI